MFSTVLRGREFVDALQPAIVPFHDYLARAATADNQLTRTEAAQLATALVDGATVPQRRATVPRPRATA
jgi:hypothetical protein